MAEGDGCPISSREKMTFPVFSFHLGSTESIMPPSVVSTILLSHFTDSDTASCRNTLTATPKSKILHHALGFLSPAKLAFKMNHHNCLSFLEVADFDLAADLRCSGRVE